jgi:ABC-type molybdate transport system permease subunit
MSKYKKVVKCKNAYNQFIIEHLQLMKLRCLQVGQEKVAFTYQKIIYAVSKYPLPILVQQQLDSIAGIGEKTSATLMKLINSNY